MRKWNGWTTLDPSAATIYFVCKHMVNHPAFAPRAAIPKVWEHPCDGCCKGKQFIEMQEIGVYPPRFLRTWEQVNKEKSH